MTIVRFNVCLPVGRAVLSTPFLGSARPGVRALPKTLRIHLRRAACKRIKANCPKREDGYIPATNAKRSSPADPDGNLSGFEFFVTVSFAPAGLSGDPQRYRDKTTHRVRADS